MAKKVKNIYSCQSCGYQSAKWLGKCPECSEWNSFVEDVVFEKKQSQSVLTNQPSVPMRLQDVEVEDLPRVKTNISEFDRVVGGGLVPGSILLIGGEPGIGKSTLLMEIMGKLANGRPNEKLLYISGEESTHQIADRSKRLGIKANNFLVYNESLWQNIQKELGKHKPAFVVLDSIQTTVSADIPSAPGTLTQIREITYELMNYAKSNNVTCFIVGHVTKDGNIAGPKVLEHMVDCVVYFEGDQLGQYRLLRSIKNRFGNTNEVGIFEMGELGLREVVNPSQYFLDSPIKDAYGKSITCILEGSRALFVEIQALVVENKYGNGRRTTQGIDSNRLAMLVAVIEKYFDLALGFSDVYLNVVGGMKLATRESDLSIIASILSSHRRIPIPDSTVFLGEVGLTGEVRSIPMIERRIKEISFLNYKKLVTSKRIANEYGKKYPIEIIGIEKAVQLEDILFN